MDFQILTDLAVVMKSLKDFPDGTIEAILDVVDSVYENMYGCPPTASFKDAIRKAVRPSQDYAPMSQQRSTPATQHPMSQAPTAPVSTSGDNTALLYLNLVNIKGLVSNILEEVKSLETILAPPILQKLYERINGHAIPIMQLLNEHAKDLQKVLQASGQSDPLSRYNSASPMGKARQMMEDPHRNVNSSQPVFPTPPTTSSTDGQHVVYVAERQSVPANFRGQPWTQKHPYVRLAHRNLSRNKHAKRERRNPSPPTQRERSNSLPSSQSETEDGFANLIAAYQSLLNGASKQSSQVEGRDKSRRPPTSAVPERDSSPSLMSSHYFDGCASVEEAMQKERELNARLETLKLQIEAENEAGGNSKVGKSPNDSETPNVSIGLSNPMCIPASSFDSKTNPPSQTVSCPHEDDSQEEEVVHEDVSPDEQTQKTTSNQASNPDADTPNI